MTPLLQDKNAIVYGGGGIGGGVARTFAREGARVFLAGRTREPLEAIAADIAQAGGSAEVAVVDVLDGQAVDEHAGAVASEAGSIDATFLAISRGDTQGTPLIDMTADDLTRAVTNGLLSTFHTSRAAARQMTKQGSGAILTLTSATSAFPWPGMGSTGPADAATESFLQTLAHEGRELHVHCYRMMGSFEEAEDLVQETLLRAWRARERFEGGRLFRAWLYRIATNACLDALRRRSRRPASVGSFAEVPWLQPYPDRLLDEIAPSEDEPDTAVVAKETIELTFLAVIQLLSPLQRAVLILRDVLGWSARETAAALDTSVAAANSALQRARARLEGERPQRTATEQEEVLLKGFIDAHERADVDAAVALLREDVRVTMPPHPWLFEGIQAVRELMGNAEGTGEWRLLPTRANRMPTAASYLRQPGDTEFRAFKFDVLRIEGGAIAEVTTFDATLFPAFGLPPVYPAQRP